MEPKQRLYCMLDIKLKIDIETGKFYLSSGTPLPTDPPLTPIVHEGFSFYGPIENTEELKHWLGDLVNRVLGENKNIEIPWKDVLLSAKENQP